MYFDLVGISIKNEFADVRSFCDISKNIFDCFSLCFRLPISTERCLADKPILNSYVSTSTFFPCELETRQIFIENKVEANREGGT